MSKKNPAATQHKTSLVIEDMTCASCVRRVEKAIRGAIQAEEVSVNLATNRADIVSADKPDLAAVAAAVKRAGYGVGQDEIDLDITGMTCASCVRRVEKALSAVEGVKEAVVNFATSRAHVRFFRQAVTARQLQDAVAKAGYEAHVATKAGGSRDAAKEGAGPGRALLVAAALTLPVFLLEMGSHLAPPFHHWLLAHIGEQPLRIFSFVLTTVVLFGPGRRFFKTGIPALLRGGPDMNSLVAVGAFAAWSYSTVATFAGRLLPEGANHVYFEAAAVIVTLILLGRYLEAGARGKTGEAIRALAGLKPASARVVRAGTEADIPVEDVAIGDIVAIRPGEKLPVDGVIVDGASHIDEAMMTGEPMPVAKSAGGQVFAGTVNGSGAFHYRAEKIGADTFLARIQQMVEDAQNARLPIQALVDRVTEWFVPGVFAIAIVTFVLWMVFAPAPALPHALVAAVAVLIIACPCAMGLATPVSIMVGTGRAARLGVLFRRGDALQSLRDAAIIAFDKTGTLTQGRPELNSFTVAEGFDRRKVLALVAAVESRSEHPIGAALVKEAKTRNIPLPAVRKFTARAGYGVSGIAGKQEIAVGADRYMQALEVDISALADMAKTYAEQGATPFYAALDGKAAAAFGVADPLKPQTRATVQALKDMGVEAVMITGDNKLVAQVIAREAGIARNEAEVLPDGKVEAVRRLQQDGKRVAFVGDGINDAPALSAADTGIAIGTGTDVAIESADVVLMSGDPAGVVNAVGISRATIRNIKQNLFWAFAYNIALIPVAAGILYPRWGVQLSPVLSAGAMAFSSIFVLANALRLRRFKLVL
ncbi:MAG: Pb, Cd, Zn and Hg-transporting ATPase [Candidatus Tokpelaia hoelldobleri]|uniref:P-type Cu(2+) transporter n=1 Tax=Candidatus Tokpelaia hoelldobleri TaxID=1902579 RepID=A0A1U9JTD2_9HYPH|nr:MAG: Pb, Cd, Zn and Hg-transporting ATPase [Candidatus Tokpelaia hoelldoblerii]